jgi:hypothetical protein
MVDPAKINLIPRLSGAKIQEMCRSMDGEALDGDWDLPRDGGFTQDESFEALRQRFVSRTPWSETLWFRKVSDRISRGEAKWGCNTVEEFAARCEAIDRLYAEIAEGGYKTQEQLGPGPRRSEVEVAIGRDGRYRFLDGRHRLAIARILDLPKIPVRVVARHTEWRAFKEELIEWADEQPKGRIYQAIDHPDLADIPAGHREDRLPLIERALDGYDGTGKRLVDIGTHFGYWCQQMDARGFICTGVEANKRCVEFARRIAIATESGHTIWRGNVVDFPAIEEQDVVLALNIFHHFLKTKEKYETLITLLRRFRAELMLFEPHVSDPPGQMANAYLNYPPEQFVDFVATHTGLSNTEFIGKAHDGRPLYRLSR